MTDQRADQRGVRQREVRDLRDPVALRDLAHPVRLRLWEELIRMGRATATELSILVGESAANCSWHLRQLARHGFVEEAPGGPGRRRPWQPVAQALQVRTAGDEREPELGPAAGALAGMLLAREVEAVWAWHANTRQAAPEWQAASFASRSLGFLTAEELAEFHAALGELVTRWFGEYEDRRDPADRPPGCRPVRFAAWAFPTDPAD